MIFLLLKTVCTENEESYVSNDTQEFGYNSHLAEDRNTLQKVEEYYQNLDVLTSELHCDSYVLSNTCRDII